MFGMFKKKRKITVTAEPHPGDNKNTMRHRLQINKHIEDLFNRVVDVKLDHRLSVEEKYALILSTMMSISRMSEKMVKSGLLFKEKEYRKISKDLKKLVDEKPSYFG